MHAPGITPFGRRLATVDLSILSVQVATGQCTPFNNLAWETWGPIPLGFYMPLGQAEICNQNGCFKWDATTDVDEFGTIL